jgi:hypothetical protein
MRIQEEDFVLADDAATLPGRERTASAVALSRVGNYDSIDRDDEPTSADGLAGKGQHADGRRSLACGRRSSCKSLDFSRKRGDLARGQTVAVDLANQPATAGRVGETDALPD